MTLCWLILEHHRPSNSTQPMDGEIYHDKAVLLRALQYAERDAKVAEFDLGEFWRDGNVSFRDVTSEVVWQALNGDIIEPDAPIAAGYVERAVA